MKMSEERIAKAVENVVASWKIEGMICTEAEIESMKRMLRGEVTLEAAVQKIIDNCLQEQKG